MPLKRTTKKNNPLEKISLSTKQCLNHIERNSRINDAEASSFTCLKASFTVEAAVLLPIFAGFFVAIMFFFRVLEVERGVQEALQYTGRKFAAASFAENYTDGFGSAVTMAAATLQVNQYLESHDTPTKFILLDRAGVSLLTSEITDHMICLRANYRMKLPIGFFGLQTFPISQSVYVRKWVGYHEDVGGADSEEIVYVTKYGTVYHRSRECSYLNPSVESVTEEEITSRRNKSGHKYYACDSCVEKDRAGGLCYITDYGESYHTRLNCSGLKRGIYMVRISEVDGRAACGKCG